MKEKIKAVVFDLDGTLGDTMDMCVANVYEVFEHYGVKPELGSIFETFGASEDGTFNKLLPEHAEEAFKMYVDVTRKNHHRCPAPFDGIKEIFDFLQGKVKIGLITGKSRQAARVTLGVFDLWDRFDEIITGEPLHFKKVEDMQNICEIFGTKPENSVYLGDMDTDIICANKAGFISCAAVWCGTTDKEAVAASHPDYTFSTTQEFLNFLKERV